VKRSEYALDFGVDRVGGFDGLLTPSPHEAEFQKVAAMLPAAEAAAKADGLKLTMGELMPVVPPDQSAAPTLRPLLQALSDQGRGGGLGTSFPPAKGSRRHPRRASG
jgi:hypothetical protein